jgi:hypothetical protein
MALHVLRGLLLVGERFRASWPGAQQPFVRAVFFAVEHERLSWETNKKDVERERRISKKDR